MGVGNGAALGAVRVQAGLEVLVVGAQLWLAGRQAAALESDWCRQLPALARYRVAPDGLLTPQGAQVPTGQLPAGAWRPLRQYLQPELAPAAYAGELVRRCRIRLMAGTEPEPAAALLTTPTAWQQWGESAPGVRLERLRFAVSADGRVLVVGTPLPPIAGRALVARGPLLLPAGLVLDPPLLAPLLPDMIGLRDGACALFHTDGSYERIAAADFAAATRSAIRLTAGGRRHE